MASVSRQEYELHALEGACSMAANSASSAKGGNFQIMEKFLARSGAHVHLNTTVSPLCMSLRVRLWEAEWTLVRSTGLPSLLSECVLQLLVI